MSRDTEGKKIFYEKKYWQNIYGKNIRNNSWVLTMNSTIAVLIFYDFLKVLELFEYRRGDPSVTANRNFDRFAHS